MSKALKQDGFALMIQLGKVCGWWWVVWLTATTYIQLAGAGSTQQLAGAGSINLRNALINVKTCYYALISFQVTLLEQLDHVIWSVT